MLYAELQDVFRGLFDVRRVIELTRLQKPACPFDGICILGWYLGCLLNQLTKVDLQRCVRLLILSRFWAVWLAARRAVNRALNLIDIYLVYHFTTTAKYVWF